MTDTEADNPANEDRNIARKARADSYYRNHLNNQQNWYDAKASRNKKISQTLGVMILVSGGVVGFLQILGTGPELIEGSGVHLIGVLTGLLGLVVVVTKGWERIGNFEETWLTYRRASELMKREYRLYINGAGDYTNIRSEEHAFRRFVENVEETISEEQNLFWRMRSGNADDSAEQQDAPQGG